MCADRDEAKVSHGEGDELPGLPVRAFRGPTPALSRRTPDAQRVRPEVLRLALRRRGTAEMAIFGLSAVAALGLSTRLGLPLGWSVVAYVFLQLSPILVFQKTFPHRCPACGTCLESWSQDFSPDRSREDAPESIRTRCPACNVEI